jgi:tetratricopeptide (TPR) repeat protein
VLLDSNAQSLHGKAILGLGKVFLATGNLEEASSFLNNYVENYLDDSDYEDGLYQQARLYIFKGEYENALIALNGFLNSYPQTRYASNALFWAGESAFRLGYLDEATTLFNRVIQGYPRSSKIEAIQYRLSLIDLQRREADLIKLLRWSHEENMFNLTEFQRRESTYKEALAKYQEKLAAYEASGGSSPFDAETIADLRAQVAEKDRVIKSLTDQLTGEASIDAPVTSANVANQIKILELKERALDLQLNLIQWKLKEEGL